VKLQSANILFHKAVFQDALISLLNGPCMKGRSRREPQWGLVQRMTRPRRYPEDGKTNIQWAGELKEYKNLCKGNMPSLSVALESNKTFIKKNKLCEYFFGC
jgi:hypothetical protein